jgi:DNA-binding transcriptional ArsR family regulator
MKCRLGGNRILKRQSSNNVNYPTLQELNLLHASICRALADPKRILILYALDHQSRHVTALAEELNIPQPTVSRHLGILRQHSLVNFERDGASVVYYLSDRRIIEVLDMMRQVMFDALAEQSIVLNQSITMERN